MFNLDVSIPLLSKYLFTISFDVNEPLATKSSNTLNPILLSTPKLKLGPFNGGQKSSISDFNVTVSIIGFA